MLGTLSVVVTLVILALIVVLSTGSGIATKDFWLGRLFPHRLAAEVPATTTGAYAFMAGREGAPITYSPCRTIRYELNLSEAPPGAEGVLGVAIQEVERATGLKFEYVGTTKRQPSDKAPLVFRLSQSDALPVVMTWATSDEAPMLEGDIAGYAGSSAISVDGRPARYVTGQVVLDADVYERLLQTPAGSREARAITMHELAHLVGLAHVDDPRELMHSRNVGQREFGPGDRAGLALLGQGRC